MVKAFIYSIVMNLLFLVVENLQGKETLLIGIVASIITIALVLYCGMQKDVNFVAKVFYSSVVAIVVTIIILILFKINDNIFNYYFNILEFNIFHKP